RRVHVGLAGEPIQRRRAVVQRSGIWMLRRQTVFDRSNPDAERPGEPTAQLVVLGCGTDHVTAPVDPQHRGRRCLEPWWTVDPYARPIAERHDRDIRRIAAAVLCDSFPN